MPQNQQGNRPGAPSGAGQGQNPMQAPRAGEESPQAGQQEEEEEETGGRQEEEEEGSEISTGRNGQSPGFSRPSQGPDKR